MELVYLVNGGEPRSSCSSRATASYPMVKAIVTNGAVGLQDRSVTRVELKTSDPVRINFPPKTPGVARDFLLRLVITADTVPEVMFAVPTGETFSFEEGGDESFSCIVGVNIFAFTETDDGLFVVNRKLVYIAHEVSFDAAVGTVDTPVRDYLLGAKYGSLPVPTRRGYTFLCWLTEDGVEVASTDTVKTSVTRLVAEWEAYVDKFAPVILAEGKIEFMTDGNAKWTIVDSVDGHDAVARSGQIGDSQSSSLFASVTGAGKLAFSWKASSETNYDKCLLYVDGVQKSAIHGETEWTTESLAVTGDGEHSIEWRYKKDGSVSRGSDCVWIDDVSWRAS